MNNTDIFDGANGEVRSVETVCEFCGKVWNKGIGIDEDNEEDWDDGVAVCYTYFAGKQICECCYDVIEKEVLLRMPDVLRRYQETREMTNG